jgi:hypothetical protein
MCVHIFQCKSNDPCAKSTRPKGTFYFPTRTLVVTLPSPSRCLHGAFGASRGWLGIYLSEYPTSQSSWLTHEGSFHVSLRIMMSLDDLRTHVAETIMSNCCLVFVRQWWRLCHASRSSTAQWQWPCSYHHDTIMRLARSVVGIGRPLYVHLIIIQSAILRQSHHHESDKLIAWIICVLRVPLLSAVCNCRHTKFHSVGIFSLII